MRLPRQTLALMALLCGGLIVVAALVTSHGRVADLSCPTHGQEHHDTDDGASKKAPELLAATSTGTDFDCSCESRAFSLDESRFQQGYVSAPSALSSSDTLVLLLRNEAASWREAPKTSPPVRV